jgi:Flp pilus assembly protein TadB
MNNVILPSTFLLTLLLVIGLFFFIRAATKDRTERVQLVSEQDEAALMPQLKEYFRSRSYRVIRLDQAQNQVTFAGFVRPSGFLAVFLTILACTGLVCLSLVLSMLFPSLSYFLPVLVIISPLSGLFYWKKAGREELVLLKMETTGDEQHRLSHITVTAHRDELTELQKAIKLEISQ